MFSSSTLYARYFNNPEFQALQKKLYKDLRQALTEITKLNRFLKLREPTTPAVLPHEKYAELCQANKAMLGWIINAFFNKPIPITDENRSFASICAISYCHAQSANPIYIHGVDLPRHITRNLEFASLLAESGATVCLHHYEELYSSDCVLTQATEKFAGSIAAKFRIGTLDTLALLELIRKHISNISKLEVNKSLIGKIAQTYPSSPNGTVSSTWLAILGSLDTQVNASNKEAIKKVIILEYYSKLKFANTEDILHMLSDSMTPYLKDLIPILKSNPNLKVGLIDAINVKIEKSSSDMSGILNLFTVCDKVYSKFDYTVKHLDVFLQNALHYLQLSKSPDDCQKRLLFIQSHEVLNVRISSPDEKDKAHITGASKFAELAQDILKELTKKMPKFSEIPAKIISQKETNTVSDAKIETYQNSAPSSGLLKEIFPKALSDKSNSNAKTPLSTATQKSYGALN